MAGFDKRLLRPVARATFVTVLSAVAATAAVVTLATLIGILPRERWWFELKISSGIAMIVTMLIAPIVITKFLSIAQEVRDAKAALQTQANTDYLTGLLNRRGFDEAAGKLIAASAHERVPVALISADIDHFKQINDTYGHTAGDKVIHAMAIAFRSATRSMDPDNYALARMGGEEFSCIVKNLTKQQMMALAEQIRTICNAVTVVEDEEEIKATISVGGSIMSHRDGDLMQLMISADRALYKAKDTGRNKAAYEWAHYRDVA